MTTAEPASTEQAPRDNHGPLTFGQQRLWLLSQIGRELVEYNVPQTFLLRGDLDVEALAWSFSKVVRRHQSMRTSLVAKGHRPEQVVAAPRPFELPVVDVSGLEDPLCEALAIAARHASQPFDFAVGPLFRCALIGLGPRLHVLSVTLSHFICDGWSLDVLWTELGALYAARTRGEQLELPDLPLQLTEYATWQRSRYEAASSELLAYWKSQLAGAPTLEMPTDYSRPLVPRNRGTKRVFRVDRPITQRLKEVGVEQGASLFMVLLTAFKITLARHAAQEDVVIGSPTAQERGRPQVRSIIGMTANMLVMRTDLSGNPTFRDALRRVRDVVLGGCLHAEMPFEKLVAELRPERDPSRNPLFDVVFVLDQPSEPILFGDLEIEPLDFEHTTTKFDITVAMVETADGLRGVLEYDLALFRAERIAQMEQHFLLLLEGIADRPDQRIWDFPMLTDAERGRAIEAGRGMARNDPSDRTIHEIFAQRVARAPHAVALRFGERKLTYAELEERANRLANRLVALGVAPDVTVGLCVERSVEMVVGMLGILKAGGAYVPLDPELPAQRLSFVVSDTQPPVLLTQAHLRERLPAYGGRVIALDADASEIAGEASTAPQSRATSRSLAYVIYTSGSTGQPKGVTVPHGAISRLVLDTDYVQLGPDDCIAQASSMSFDAATFEIWGALLNGAQLVSVGQDVSLSPTHLAETIRADGITTLFVTTALFNQLEAGALGVFAPLRYLLFGGEAVDPARVRSVLENEPPQHLLHVYGPTENTTFSTWFEVSEVGADAITVPIGRPVASTSVYVLDRELEPVPVGVPGELCTGGDGVARGYANAPSLTAEKFVPDPFSPHAGGRLYRTGDVARRREDGAIEFLGRRDHQVKIRGYRIELGEIEQVLNVHEDVRGCAVVPQTRRSGDVELAAYVVAASGRVIEVAALHRFLLERFPDYMVPPVIVVREALPLTANGKVDRKGLTAAKARDEVAREDALPPRGEIEERVAEVWRTVLEIGFVGREDSLFELGGHSLHVVRLRRELEREFEIEIAVSDLFQYPSVAAMASRLALQCRAERRAKDTAQAPDAAPSHVATERGTTAIAIVGMSGRFPQAADLEEFWDNLCAGREAISLFTLDEVREGGGVSESLLQDKDYVRARSILDDVDQFDAAFFSISPREAERMDPQVRLFLETAWTAIENAGYDALHMPGSVGVYAGSGLNSYERNNLAANAEFVQSAQGFDLSIGGWQFLTMRVSHKLDLTGPSIQMHTACSTSLVAVVQACEALAAGHCDMALAGGSNICFPQRVGHLYREGEISSPDGHCRPFDRAAQGTVGGEGVGVVLLKPLGAALRDGDAIRAVIIGTGLNNDGASKVGFTAPSVDGQAKAIAAAHSAGDIDPATIGYVECHGTATSLGDPIEIAALTKAFRLRTDRTGFCGVGSLKSNLGHLDVAAGIAGLIKGALTLEREAIPPSLHFKEPNPEIDFENSPFTVNAELRPWLRGRGQAPRRAAVSAFGVGGTNAHVVLEEAPVSTSAAPARSRELLVVAAKSASALETMAAQLAVHLRVNPDQSFADVAWTMQAGRTPFRHRLALVAADAEEAAEILETGDSKRTFRGIQDTEDPPVVFLFPGQGTQYVNMGGALYADEPVFRAEVDTCCEMLQPHLGLDLRELLFPDALNETHTARLGQTWLTQPAIFVIEYALAKLWMAWGVRPQAMLGHSIGEYVAACLAGVFSLQDALRLVAARGRLAEDLPEGGMLAVSLSEEEVLSLLGSESSELSLSAINGPSSCVIGGPSAAVAALSERLAAQRIPSQRLRANRAFHSSMMEPVADAFAALVREAEFGHAELDCVSTVTGTWLRADEWADAEYWVKNLRQPVRFSDAVQEVLADEHRVLLEVGPGQTLTALVKQRDGGPERRTVLASMHHPRYPQSEQQHLLGTLAQLWVAGVRIDWRRFAGEGRRRVALPTYPFERKRHWVDPSPSAAPLLQRERKPQIADWFYVPSWQRTGTPRGSVSPATRGWLIFADDVGVAVKLLERLSPESPVVEVRVGASFQRLDQGTYELRPGVPEDYETLLRDLAARDAVPDRVLHLWGVVDLPQLDPLDTCDVLEDRCFYSLLWFGQALTEHAPEARIQLDVVTNDLFAVTGGEAVHPVRATVLGPFRDLPIELPGLRCRLTDFRLDDGDAALTRLVAEFSAPPAASVVAYRGGYRWVMTCAPLRLEPPTVGMPWARAGGTYLITGGLGGLGLAIAELLAEAPGTKLVLLARRSIPAPSAWDSWVTEHGENDRTSRRIRRLQAFQRAGVEVHVEAADVSDAEAMRAVLARVRARFGELRGVVHAAGVATGGMVAVRTREGAAEVLRPKVKGTLVLQSLLRDEPLEFMVLCSSLSSVLGGVGTIDYTGANAFLDAFAQQHDAHPWPVFGINWDVWSESGMAVEGHVSRAWTAKHDERLRMGLSDGDGQEVFRRALSSGEPQVLVSTFDLMTRLPSDDLVEGLEDPVDQSAAAAGGRGRLEPPTSSEAPQTDIEQAIAAVVQDTFGVTSVGRHDNLFDLGLDSLIGYRLIARLKKQHGIVLSMLAILESPIIAELATLVNIVADLAEPAPVPPASSGPRVRQHPLLGRWEQEGARHVWTSALGPATHWVLSEHRLGGRPVLPGTAYLEMARAAFEQLADTELTDERSIELRKVHFVHPLAVDGRALCAVRTVLTQADGVVDFLIESCPDSDGALEHAFGQLAVVDSGQAPRHDLGELRARYPERGLETDSAAPEDQGSIVEFGPRWASVRRTWSGPGARLTFVELDPEFAAQDRGFGLHPALLDIAVGYGAEVGEEQLPFGYDRVLVRGPMPSRLFSLSEERASRSPDERVFDIAVLDESGVEVVRIDGYTMRKAARTPPADSSVAGQDQANVTLEITIPGLLDELAFVRTERVAPGPHEVEIEVAVTGLNFKDVLYALGAMPSPNGGAPDLGLECAGTITRVGNDVTAFVPGDEVVALASRCFSAYLTVATESVAKCPSGLSPVEAATVPCAYLTAHHALVAQGRLQPGEKVLIHAAAGGVGLAAVKIAQQIGAEVFATAGSDRKRDFLRSLGIEHVMSSRTLEFAGEVMARTTGRGVDVLLNSLSGDYISTGLSVLAPYGRFLELGAVDIHADTPIGLGSFEKSLSFSAVKVGPGMPTFAAEWHALMQRFAQGVFQALPHQTFAAVDVVQAFQHMADAQHIGKIVVSMGGRSALDLLDHRG